MGMIGQLLTGRYLILEQLGSGGFSETYLARDKYLPHYPLCVVKCLKLSAGNTISLESAQRLFEMEARVLAEIGGNHSQIPALFAYSRDHQPAYLVQEHIDGESLSAWLQQDQPLSSEKATKVLSEILSILVYLHSRNVIHRDIKPGNLICREQDGKLVLIDFGAAYFAPEAAAITVTDSDLAPLSIGTPGYMPDEQHLDESDFNSDLYAAGMLMIHLLTGVHPQQFRQDPISGELDWQDYLQGRSIAPELITILSRMVQIKASDRYPSAEAALQDLQPMSAQRTWRQSSGQGWQRNSLQWALRPVLIVLLASVLGSKMLGGFSQTAEALMTQIREIQIIPQRDVGLKAIKDIPLESASGPMLISPNNQVLVTVTANHTIERRSLPDLASLPPLVGHSQQILAMAVSPDNQRLVSAAKDGTLRIWDMATGKLLKVLSAQPASIQTIAISPDGQMLISGGQDSRLRLWNLRTGKLEKTISLPNQTVTTAVAYGTTPNIAMSASSDDQVQIWDLQTGKLVRAFDGSTGQINGLQAMNDQIFFSFGQDQTIMWDLENETMAQHLPDSGKSIVASVNDRHIMTVHENGKIHVWIMSQGRAKARKAGQLPKRSTVALSSDHHYLVSWSSDKRLRVWQVDDTSLQ